MGMVSLVIMGVAGCGKSTLGRELARRLGRPFVEGDDLHPRANVIKMAAGVQLTDQDRLPFLAAVATAIASAENGVVVSCSALKRVYRRMIIQDAMRPVFFVLPQLTRLDLEKRLAARVGHFMPASLLQSQLADFEPLQPDEHGLIVDGRLSPAEQVDQILASPSVSAFLGGVPLIDQ